MRAREAYRYLRRWQRRLRLQDWDLSVHTHQGDHVHPDWRDNGRVVMGGIANTVPQTQSAEVHIGVYGDARVVRNTIRHELLHVRLADTEAVFEQALSALGPESREMLRGLWDVAIERAIDAIAAAFEEDEPT